MWDESGRQGGDGCQDGGRQTGKRAEIDALKRQLAVLAVAGAPPPPPAADGTLDGRVPLEYVCPIARAVMDDPVVAADGATYERAAIEAWLRDGNTTSPLTGAPLPHPGLTPNLALAAAIKRFKAPEKAPSFGRRAPSFAGRKW